MRGRWLLVVAAVAAAGCSNDCVVTDVPTPVLVRPFLPPFGAVLGPDVQISTLAPGVPVRMLNDGYGKDFAYYEVRLADGARGFVIFDAHVAVVKNCVAR